MCPSSYSNSSHFTGLIEHIREKAQSPPNPDTIDSFKSYDLPPELQDFEDVERYMHGDHHTFARITGILPEHLPPLKKLTDAECTVLFDELHRLLTYYGYQFVFPKKLPVEHKYKALKKIWLKSQPYLGPGTNGFIGIEFCSYEPKECPWPAKYCNCHFDG